MFVKPAKKSIRAQALLLAFILAFSLTLFSLPLLKVKAADTIEIDFDDTFAVDAAERFEWVDNFGSDYTLKINSSGSYEIKSIGGTPYKDQRIIVADGLEVSISLNNIKIDVKEANNDCAFSIGGGSSVTVDLVGDNAFISGQNRAGIEVPESSSLTITASEANKDGNSLLAQSGKGPTAGVSTGNGAGIGGPYVTDEASDATAENAGPITIGGYANVTAKSYNGAAIGSGFVYSENFKSTGGSGGVIGIGENAVVNAQSYYGAAIGSGYTNSTNGDVTGGSGGKITISGNARIEAESDFGAAIGSGYTFSMFGNATGGSGGEILISGNALVQAKCEFAAVIGSGSCEGYINCTVGDGGTITIHDKAVVIAAAGSGAAIGSGSSYNRESNIYGGSGGIITIKDDAQVTASSEWGAGIGSAFVQCLSDNPAKLVVGGDGGIINIIGNSKVTATSKHCPAIGSGYTYVRENIAIGGSGGEITIGENANVSATSINSAAIGSGDTEGKSSATGGSGGIITISGNATVSAASTKGVAMGSGNTYTDDIGGTLIGGNGGSISINDNATVTAKSDNGVVIGTGNVGKYPEDIVSLMPGGSFVMNGGNVTVSGGKAGSNMAIIGTGADFNIEGVPGDDPDINSKSYDVKINGGTLTALSKDDFSVIAGSNSLKIDGGSVFFSKISQELLKNSGGAPLSLAILDNVTDVSLVSVNGKDYLINSNHPDTGNLYLYLESGKNHSVYVETKHGKGHFTINAEGGALLTKSYVPVFEFSHLDKIYANGSSDDFNMTIYHPHNVFSGVEVDGAVVAAEFYTATEGSTRLSFANSWLDTLANGEHSLVVSFSDGRSVRTVFHVNVQNTDTNTGGNVPQTGDSGVLPFVGLAVISLLALAAAYAALPAKARGKRR